MSQRERPAKYDVTVIVTPSGDPRLDDPEAEISVRLSGIPRASIMAPGYPLQIVRDLVEQFEHSVFDDEEAPE